VSLHPKLTTLGISLGGQPVKHRHVEPPEQYQEPPSSEQFEQQPGEFEEGKYNINLLSLFNTISSCILILYTYKDFPATLSFTFIPWVAFWLVVLGAALSHMLVHFN
jgi:hypothetical protein